jgi:sec-independent protein translocase protein TatA
MSFFDAPWHIVILLLAALLLFGSSRLPGAARALGTSMNIFKKAVKHGEDEPGSLGSMSTQATFNPPPAQIMTPPAADSKQAQIDDLQRQLNDLQRQQAPADATPTSDAQSQSQSY